MPTREGMENKPCVLIVSNSNTKPSSIIKLITKQHTINAADTNDKVIRQPWSIKTKYYTSTIHLVAPNKCVKQLETDKDAPYMSAIEALIFHMDTNKLTSLQEMNEWTDIMDTLAIQPEIKMLLTNYCDDQTAISQDAAQSWCLQKGFELIELYPKANNSKSCTDSKVGDTEEDTVSEDEDSPFGKEKQGIERVIEALENNIWSNMEVTDKDGEASKNNCDNIDDDAELYELFSNLISMKSSITSLPSNVRKQCAEQIVTTFWKAIGGDEDEIADL